MKKEDLEILILEVLQEAENKLVGDGPEGPVESQQYSILKIGEVQEVAGKSGHFRRLVFEYRLETVYEAYPDEPEINEFSRSIRLDDNWKAVAVSDRTLIREIS